MLPTFRIQDGIRTYDIVNPAVIEVVDEDGNVVQSVFNAPAIENGQAVTTPNGNLQNVFGTPVVSPFSEGQIAAGQWMTSQDSRLQFEDAAANVNNPESPYYHPEWAGLLTEEMLLNFEDPSTAEYSAQLFAEVAETASEEAQAETQFETFRESTQDLLAYVFTADLSEDQASNLATALGVPEEDLEWVSDLHLSFLEDIAGEEGMEASLARELNDMLTEIGEATTEDEVMLILDEIKNMGLDSVAEGLGNLTESLINRAEEDGSAAAYQTETAFTSMAFGTVGQGLLGNEEYLGTVATAYAEEQQFLNPNWVPPEPGTPEFLNYQLAVNGVAQTPIYQGAINFTMDNVIDSAFGGEFVFGQEMGTEQFNQVQSVLNTQIANGMPIGSFEYMAFDQLLRSVTPTVDEAFLADPFLGTIAETDGIDTPTWTSALNNIDPQIYNTLPEETRIDYLAHAIWGEEATEENKNTVVDMLAAYQNNRVNNAFADAYETELNGEAAWAAVQLDGQEAIIDGRAGNLADVLASVFDPFATSEGEVNDAIGEILAVSNEYNPLIIEAIRAGDSLFGEGGILSLNQDRQLAIQDASRTAMERLQGYATTSATLGMLEDFIIPVAAVGAGFLTGGLATAAWGTSLSAGIAASVIAGTTTAGANTALNYANEYLDGQTYTTEDATGDALNGFLMGVSSYGGRLVGQYLYANGLMGVGPQSYTLAAAGDAVVNGGGTFGFNLLQGHDVPTSGKNALATLAIAFAAGRLTPGSYETPLRSTATATSDDSTWVLTRGEQELGYIRRGERVRIQELDGSITEHYYSPNGQIFTTTGLTEDPMYNIAHRLRTRTAFTDEGTMLFQVDEAGNIIGPPPWTSAT